MCKNHNIYVGVLHQNSENKLSDKILNSKVLKIQVSMEIITSLTKYASEIKSSIAIENLCSDSTNKSTELFEWQFHAAIIKIK